MQDSLWNLLGLSKIPKVFSQIPASPACYIHFSWIVIVTLWAFSSSFTIYEDFTFKSAFMTIIRFGIKLSILDIVINKLNQSLQCRKVFLHIWDLNIGNCSSWRDFLKLWLKDELAHSINLFSHINMVRIGIIALICNIFDFSKTLFIYLGKTITETFCWRSV